MRFLENYRLLAEDLGFDIRRGVCARQMHTDNIRIVTENDCGKGIFQQESDIRDTDGLITNQRGIALIIFSADCVPLLFMTRLNKLLRLHMPVGGELLNKSAVRLCV